MNLARGPGLRKKGAKANLPTWVLPVVALVAESIFGFVFLRDVRRDIALQSSRVRASGTVGAIQHQGTSGKVWYVYEVGNKTFQNQDLTTSSSATWALAEGDSVVVRYDEKDPSLASIDFKRFQFNTYVREGIGFLWITVFFAATLLKLKRAG